MASKKTGGAFGRDEMNLLLGVTGGDESKAGIGTAGTALLQSRGFADASNKTRSKGNKKEGIDFSALSTAETAALIQQEQLSKGVVTTASRHRAQRSHAKKKLAHHELLEQELLAQQQQQLQKQQQEIQQQQERAPQSESEEEEEAEFPATGNKKKAQSSHKRIQLEPQIVAQKDAPRRQRQRRQRSSSSESSDDSDNERRPQRRRRDRKEDSSSDESSTANRRRRRRSHSSSSSSSSEDERRQKRLQKRQQLEAKSKEEFKGGKIEKVDNGEQQESTKELPSKPVEKQIGGPSPEDAPKRRTRQQESSGSSASSSSDGSSSDSSSDSSSSSEDEPTPVMAKPLFVPKRKRLQLEQEKLEAERAQKEQEEASNKLEQKRKMESRALVAQVVSTGTIAGANDDGMVSEDEEALAERMLDDKDDKDEDNERDLWEVRELGRLLEEIDRLRKKEQEEAEYRRRQQLTDEQAQAEDMASGRYQQPGINRTQGADKKDQPKYIQKYFHRGAYYMDEDEFEEGDVRLRAKEYEQGVTESAKSRGDTRKLPQIMQVKQFGRANQSKYQGLTKEDTSNKESSTLLPLVHHKQSYQQRKTTDIDKHRKKS